MDYIAYVFMALLFALAAILFIHFIRRKMNQVTHSIGGVILSQLASALKDKQVSFSDLNPIGVSSPKSISDLSSAYLPVISKDFPDLNVHELISAAQNALLLRFERLQTLSDTKMQEFESRISFPSLSIGTTAEYDFELSQTIHQLRMAGETDIYERVRIHASGINRYEKKGGTCQLIIQSALEYCHYVKRNHQIVDGNDAILEQIRYNIEVVYIQDQSKLATSETTAIASNCPNCGGPIRQQELAVCEYCGSAVRTVDMRIWRVNRIEKV